MPWFQLTFKRTLRLESEFIDIANAKAPDRWRNGRGAQRKRQGCRSSRSSMFVDFICLWWASRRP